MGFFCLGSRSRETSGEHGVFVEHQGLINHRGALGRMRCDANKDCRNESVAIRVIGIIGTSCCDNGVVVLDPECPLLHVTDKWDWFAGIGFLPVALNV